MPVDTKQRRRSLPDDLDWISFDDFRPGIYTRAGKGVSTEIWSPGPFGSARPPKSTSDGATKHGTYRCHALPQGGLAPLPGRNTNFGIYLNTTAHAPASGTISFEDIKVLKNVYATGPGAFLDEVHIAFEYISNTDFADWTYSRPQSGLNINQTGLLSIGGVNASGPPVGASFASQILAHGASAPVPILAYGYPGATNLYLFPSLTAPNTDAVSTIALPANSLGAGLLDAHQSRLIPIIAAAANSSVLNIQHGASSNFAPNQIVGYTDPPGADTSILTELLTPEDPFGYGGIKSSSASTLLLIQQYGGGVVVQGDVNNPVVYKMPNVMPTLGVVAKVADTPIGCVYLTAQGAYVWAGGDASHRISNQLENDFYAKPNASLISGGGFGVGGNRYDVCSWGNFIVVSNNWLYDIETESWWLLDDPRTAPGGWFDVGMNGNLWMLNMSVPAANIPTTVGARYDLLTPANNYNWESQPLQISDRYMDCREVILVAAGTGTVTVSVLQDNADSSPTTSQITFNVSSDAPTVQRAVIQAQTSQIAVAINSTGTGSNPAPVVYECHVGYKDVAPVATV